LNRQPSVKKVKPVEEVKQEPIPEVEEDEQEPIQEPVKPDKKVRVQELVECPDCNKMITPKSFKYPHKKTCSANTPSAHKSLEPVIEKAKPKEKSKPLAPQHAIIHQQPLSMEERRNQALKMREERVTDMFMNTLRR
jgi:hypothetical protein